MIALILSGGEGKRLKPLTDYVPKSLIPLNNTPIIEWQIRYFKKFGINEFVICAGYKSEQIINYLDSKNILRTKIHYSIEKIPLGTGGAIKKASRFIHEKNFFVVNGDVITDLNVKLLKTNSIATIPLKTTFGILDLRGNKVKRFIEKTEISDYWMNAGVYYLSSDIVKHLPKKGNIEKTTFPKLAKKGVLNSVRYTNVFWHSIDSHKDIEDCANEMKAIRYENFLMKK